MEQRAAAHKTQQNTAAAGAVARALHDEWPEYKLKRMIDMVYAVREGERFGRRARTRQATEATTDKHRTASVGRVYM